MNTQEINALSDAMYEKLQELSKALKAFPKNEVGLTPDHVKQLPEWKAAKKAYDSAFRELRVFNAMKLKTIKKARG